MKVGIQLFSVKESMQKDPIKTIQQVSEAGYKYLEVANSNADKDPGVGFDVGVEEMKKVLEETGSKVISAHISPLNMENIDSVLNYHKELGTKYIAYPMEFFTSKEQTIAFAKKLDELGALCNKSGIKLLYHNHFQEFLEFEGEAILDIIMDNANSENLGLQMDTYWAMRSGSNPIDVLKKYGKRIKLIHQKDYPHNMEKSRTIPERFKDNPADLTMEDFMPLFSPDHFIEIGKGMMDIQEIINTTNEFCDSKYIILEQDITKHTEIESIKISMEEFKKFDGIEFN